MQPRRSCALGGHSPLLGLGLPFCNIGEWVLDSISSSLAPTHKLALIYNDGFSHWQQDRDRKDQVHTCVSVRSPALLRYRLHSPSLLRYN